MKTKYKYIHFKMGHPENLEQDWICCNNKTNDLLGEFHFNKKWKCYEFWPCGMTAFTDDCLADIIDFIKQLEVKK